MVKASDMWKTALASGVVVVVAVFAALMATGNVSLNASGNGVQVNPGGGGSVEGCGFLAASVLPASSENCKADATVNVAAYDDGADGQTQVPSTTYAIQHVKDEDANYLGSKETNTVSDASFTMGRGDKYSTLTFNSSGYAYGVITEDVIDRSTVNAKNLVLNSITSGPKVDVYDENGDIISGSQTFNDGQGKTFEKVKITANESDAGYNVGFIGLDWNGTKLDDDETTIQDDDVTEIDCPDTYNTYKVCFRYDKHASITDADLSGVLQDNNFIEVTGLHVKVEDGSNPSNTDLDVTVDDWAPYIDDEAADEADRFAEGIVDEDGNDVGENGETTTVNLN